MKSSATVSPRRALIAGFFLAQCAFVQAQTIFTEDFEAFSGGYNNAQADSGFAVGVGVNGPGWAEFGAGTAHLVDLNNPNGSGGTPPTDIAILFWQDNELELENPIPNSNDSGTVYQVEYLAAPGVYADDDGNPDTLPSQGTIAGLMIRIQVIRDSDGAVLHENFYEPGDWPVGPGGPAYVTDSFTYAGDGSGDIRLRIGSPPPHNFGRFTGSISHLTVSTATTLTPRINSFTPSPGTLANAGDPLTLDWEVDLSLPLDSLTLDPGGLDLLPDTDGSGAGTLVLDPGPVAATTYTLTAVRGGESVSRDASVTILASPGTDLFTADFNDFNAPHGNFNAAQEGTGFQVVFGGSIPGWSGFGANAIHAVDTANAHPSTPAPPNPREFAPMFIVNNVMTLIDPIPGSNASGTVYQIDFDASPATYASFGEGTGPTDGVVIDVLRPDNSVLASYTSIPGPWASTMNFTADSFQFTGDGTGDVRIRFSSLDPGVGRFGGAVDNLAVSVASSIAPEIISFTSTPESLSNAGDPVTFDWEVNLNQPLDSLTLDPGGIDVLPATDGAGLGSHILDPGPNTATTYTLTAMRGGRSDSRELTVAILPPPGGTVFEADFNDFTGGNFNGGQFESGLDLAFGGSLPEWAKAGGGVVHAVDHANQTGNIINPRDFAVMIWQDNVITLLSPIPSSNATGVDYLLEFEASPAVYQAGNQQTSPTDGLLIELLRDDDSVFDSFFHEPGQWAGDTVLVPDLVSYTGDGSGNLRLRIGPSAPGSGRFGGAIDNVRISIANPLAPEISSFAATPSILSDAGEAVVFDWEVGVPLSDLILNPGNIDLLGETDETGVGSFTLDPGPDGTTEYTLTATRDGQSVSRRVTVTLPAPAIASFTASPSPSEPGQAVTLSWEVGLPATSLTITPGDLDVLGDTDEFGAGSIILDPGPTETTTFTLTATRGTSTSTAETTSIVTRPPNPNALFAETFDGFTAPAGNFNGGQFESGLAVVHSGDLPGWSKSGGGTVHAVDLANFFPDIINPRNFAPMMWQDNVITQDTAVVGSNEAGAEYVVEFDAGPAVYQAGSQQTSATDGLLIEVLRADDSVLAELIHLPGAWAGFPTLVPQSFSYTGDGTGDIRLRVSPSAFNSGRFGGTIDNLVVAPSTPAAAPEIVSIELDAQTGAACVTFTSQPGVIYSVDATLNLLPDDWQNLDDEVVGTGETTKYTDSFFAPLNPLEGFYRVERLTP